MSRARIQSLYPALSHKGVFFFSGCWKDEEGKRGSQQRFLEEELKGVRGQGLGRGWQNGWGLSRQPRGRESPDGSGPPHPPGSGVSVPDARGQDETGNGFGGSWQQSEGGCRAQGWGWARWGQRKWLFSGELQTLWQAGSGVSSSSFFRKCALSASQVLDTLPIAGE